MSDEITGTTEGLGRRHFLSKAALGAAGLGVGGALLAACGDDDTPGDDVALSQDLPDIEWQMATSWPLALDTIYGGAEVFADTLSAITGGKFRVTPRAAGELAPGLEVLNVVEQGAVEIGHTASYYYIGKSPITAFGTSVPFGLTARQQNAWLYEAGGLELLQAAYAEKFGVIQFPAGNTGVQMGGWFNKEINSVDDLAGLKMRIPGLGGQVMDKLGVNVQVIAGGEIVQALQQGTIDAAEWVGPYDDTNLGIADAARFYYYPGWWEPGPSLEIQIGLDAWNGLPEEYQQAVAAAAYVANVTMMARYDAKNPAAFADLIARDDVELRPFPEDVMLAAKEASDELLDELAADDADFKSILDPWRAFRDSIQPWHATAETAFLEFASRNA